ncbi:extracellular solute-binding protein [Nocardioides eburneiflavus]|uniref:extracellular solute-binding protein n=1 Tax=Nocardioides eburneiflavus TaxID=2518372 RepID=UPI001B2FFA3E|nr:extracellular solute-binding protein [Nocardioides eburneiflavus]
MAPLAALALASSLLAACGGDSGTPELVWYINPDSGGQAAVAEACSTDEYTITTQVLPQDANQQRIQLARRLAAGDSGIDIMSIDPPFTAEFAEAGYLAEIPEDLQQTFRDQAFESAATAATWEDQLVVAPFWSNTQVLWYRKSLVEQTDLDMEQPVTWQQIIEAASANDATVAVQANKYEGYSVWINALISGAGGDIASETERGADAQVDIDSDAGREAAKVIAELASSEAAPADLSIAQEGQAAATFGGDRGAFMVNWTYILNGAGYSDEVVDDLGWARYPQTVEGEESRPPYGGIGIGVSEFSDDKELAVGALECLTSPENQALNAELTGNMPSSEAGYDEQKVQELFPGDLLELFQESLEAAAPRTASPYWSDISGGIQSTWHPPSGVDEQTPGQAKQFIEDVLQGRSLL